MKIRNNYYNDNKLLKNTKLEPYRKKRYIKRNETSIGIYFNEMAKFIVQFIILILLFILNTKIKYKRKRLYITDYKIGKNNIVLILD